jgi:hypothetical protein
MTGAFAYLRHIGFEPTEEQVRDVWRSAEDYGNLLGPYVARKLDNEQIYRAKLAALAKKQSRPTRRRRQSGHHQLPLSKGMWRKRKRLR